METWTGRISEDSLLPPRLTEKPLSWSLIWLAPGGSLAVINGLSDARSPCSIRLFTASSGARVVIAVVHFILEAFLGLISIVLPRPDNPSASDSRTRIDRWLSRFFECPLLVCNEIRTSVWTSRTRWWKIDLDPLLTFRAFFRYVDTTERFLTDSRLSDRDSRPRLTFTSASYFLRFGTLYSHVVEKVCLACRNCL